jgi:hypothetical protein
METRADHASTLLYKMVVGPAITFQWLFSEIKLSTGPRYSTGKERLRGDCRGIDTAFRGKREARFTT